MVSFPRARGFSTKSHARTFTEAPALTETPTTSDTTAASISKTEESSLRPVSSMASNDRDQTDPDWPNGYPAVVIQQFTAQPGGGYISASIGDEVFVVSSMDSIHQSNVCIEYDAGPDGTFEKIGWVPFSILVVGKTRKIGEPIGFDSSQIEMPKILESMHAGNQYTDSLFGRTVLELLSAYSEHYDKLPAIPLYIPEILGSQDKVEQFAEVMYHGVPAYLLSYFDNMATSTLVDIFEASSLDAVQLAGKGGIYMILYSDYPGQPRRCDVYSGSTFDFDIRDQQHEDAANQKPPTGVHYRSAAKAHTRQMVPVCIVKSENQRYVKLMEQVFIDLFQTTCPEVLGYGNQTLADTDDAYESNTIRDSEEAEKVAVRRETDSRQAIAMRQIALQVFKKTGWPGSAGHSAKQDLSVKTFGANKGLNWTMPISEFQLVKTIWSRTGIPGKVLNFSRPATTVTTIWDSKVALTMVRQADDNQFQFFIPMNVTGPAVGQRAYVTFEIMIDGSSHPSQWARTPTIGIVDDWFDATTLALRIEWQDEKTGQWQWRYLKAENTNFKVKDAPKGITMGYAVATGVRAFLLREIHKPTEDMPWIMDFGIARVREIAVRHLDRVVTSTPIESKPSPQKPKAMKSFDQVGKELLGLGARVYAKSTDADANTNYPPKDFKLGDTAEFGERWKTCDHCRLNKVSGGIAFIRCDKLPDKNQCTHCEDLGRPCTFTPDSELFPNAALKMASVNPPQDTEPPRVIEKQTLVEF